MKKIFCVAMFLAQMTFAQELTIYTEDSPPFQYMKDGKITGVASDLLNAMMQKSGIQYKHEMVPWKRAYDGALSENNVCVYSTTETPERMPLFKWVGPIVDNNWVMMVSKDSAINATKLEDMKSFTIGGYTDDAVAQYLKGLGYKVDEAANDGQNVKKLQGGRIDAWATSSVVGPYLAKEEGITDLRTLFTFKSTVMSLACNKGIPDDVINKLKKALKDIEADGTISKIKSNYK